MRYQTMTMFSFLSWLALAIILLLIGHSSGSTATLALSGVALFISGAKCNKWWWMD